MDMDKEELEFRNEMEKLTTPVPRRTIEAAIEKAHRMATQLRSYSRPELTRTAAAKVKKCAEELASATECYRIVPVLMLTRVPADCAEEFDTYADDCQQCLDRQEEEQIGRAESLVRLAGQVRAFKNPSIRKVTAALRRIAAGDVSRSDILRNFNNIDLKAKGDKGLATLVDWRKLQGMCPGVSRTSKLGELDVDTIKAVLVCLKGSVD